MVNCKAPEILIWNRTQVSGSVSIYEYVKSYVRLFQSSALKMTGFFALSITVTVYFVALLKTKILAAIRCENRFLMLVMIVE